MTRTLYLHIGSHKTGTTSIQHFLAERTQDLAARGFAYPISNSKARIGSLLGGVDDGAEEGESATELGRKTRLVLKMLSEIEAPHVIVSSEGFSYVNDKGRLALFHQNLKQIFDRIIVITYLRRQDQFAISHHQEGANPQSKPAARLHGHRPTALPETSELQRRYLDYDTRIGTWADVFGETNMVVRLYDRARLKNGDVVADFLQIVGLADMDASVAAVRNVSMGFTRSKIGHLLHQVVPDQAARQFVLSRLADEGRLLPSREAARAFLEPYREGNRRLNARFKVSEAPDLFSDDFSIYPEVPADTWTEETANAAILACLELIRELTGERVGFDAGDYAAAGRALEASDAKLALRFMTAARGMQAEGSKTRSRLDRQMVDIALTAEVAAEAARKRPESPRKAERRARRKAEAGPTPPKSEQAPAPDPSALPKGPERRAARRAARSRRPASGGA